jgi:hypothetical protein
MKCLLLTAATLAACVGVLLSNGDDGEADTVRALKYETQVYRWPDIAHCDPEWIEELYFPERGIFCNVILESDWDLDGSPPGDEIVFSEEGEDANPTTGRLKTITRHIVSAHYGKIRNVSHLMGGATSESKPVEVEVPLELAQSIFCIAEMNKLRDMMGERVGKDLVKGGLLIAK